MHTTDTRGTYQVLEPQMTSIFEDQPLKTRPKLQPKQGAPSKGSRYEYT